jgi:hypothetical protein
MTVLQRLWSVKQEISVIIAYPYPHLLFLDQIGSEEELVDRAVRGVLSESESAIGACAGRKRR